MPHCKGKVTAAMVEYFGNDYRRINHALEVLRFAENIAEENDNFDYDVLVASALLHDIGIKQSEEELGYNNGATQEKYGPPVAKKLLNMIGFPEQKTSKVCEIIGNHHSKPRFDYPELKILKTADAIVNKLEHD